MKSRTARLFPGEALLLGQVSFAILPPGGDSQASQAPGYQMAPGEYRIYQNCRVTLVTNGDSDDLVLQSGVLPLTVREEAPPPFVRLTGRMRGMWLQGQRELVVLGDGQAGYRLLNFENEERYRDEFKMTDEQHQALVEALETTQWLSAQPEKPMVTDATELSLELQRRGQTVSTTFIDHQTTSYQRLVNVLRGLTEQEHSVYQLTAGTADQRLQAARDIKSELSERLEHPERDVLPHRELINYRRFVPVLTPWLKEPKKHSREEIAAAVKLVSYLRLASERETVEGLMGIADDDDVCEALVRLGDPRSIPVLKERALKSGAAAACWALIRMGKPAQQAIIDILETPQVPNNNPAYKMVRVYLEHFNELPEPIAPPIVKAIRTAEEQAQYSSSMKKYSEILVQLIGGGDAVQGLRVSIELEQEQYTAGKPIPVKWRIENIGEEPRTILWHPLHYSPIVFRFMKAGGVEYIRADIRRSIVDELPGPPEALTLQPGESREKTVDLKYYMDGMQAGTFTLAGYYWPRAEAAAIPAEFLKAPQFKNAVLDRIGSLVQELNIRREPMTAKEEKREAARRELETKEKEAAAAAAAAAEHRAATTQNRD